MNKKIKEAQEKLVEAYQNAELAKQYIIQRSEEYIAEIDDIRKSAVELISEAQNELYNASVEALVEEEDTCCCCEDPSEDDFSMHEDLLDIVNRIFGYKED